MINYTGDDGSNLTPREFEVLQLVAKGLNNPDIAKELSISKSTAKAHVSAIIRKFKVKNRLEAVLAAIRNKYCDN